MMGVVVYRATLKTVMGERAKTLIYLKMMGLPAKTLICLKMATIKPFARLEEEKVLDVHWRQHDLTLLVLIRARL
jgi:hypothetical protein